MNSKKIYVNQSFVSDKAKKLVNEVMNSNWIGLGRMVAEFEEKFADYCGAKYCIATNSATAAIHLSLLIANKDNTKVLTTPITFVSVNNCILQVNSEPIFCDVDQNTGNISISSIKDNIGFDYNLGAILTHYAGNLIDEEIIKYIINMLGKEDIINDYSHCAGARYLSDYPLINADYNVFSFHAIKNISSPDGGAIVTNNQDVYNLAKKLRWCGIDKSTYERETCGYNWKYNVDELGYKYHMNDIAAAFCIANLEDLEENNRFRLSILKRYGEELHPLIEMVPFNEGSSGHLAVIKLPKLISRDRFIEELVKVGIYCGVHYIPNNKYGIFEECKYPTPFADYFFDRIISLPCHLLMSEDDINYVINSVNELIEKESYKN